MLLLTNTGTADKIQATTSSTSAIDFHVSWVDASNAVPPVVQGDTMGRLNMAYTTAKTDDICPGPASNEVRNVKTIHARNKGSATNDVTITYDQAGTDYELFKASLTPGAALEYVEGIGFFVVNTATLDAKLRVAGSDYVNATTSPSDITGLTCAVESGKHYNFMAHLYHFGNAATNGPRFGIAGVAMTAMRIQAILTETGSVAAGVVNTNIADVTAIDTAVQATTDTMATTPVLSIFSGWFNPSASGTWAIRGWAETAVAAALTVKVGSWARVWEV
jgi:hypothetical protein